MAEINKFAWPDEYFSDLAELGKMLGKYKFNEVRDILDRVFQKLAS